MADNDATDLPMYHKVEKTEAFKVIILGILVGIIIPLLGMAVTSWVINPIFCQDPNNTGVCQSGELIGYYVSATLITIVAVALLANLNVYRPIVIAFGTLIALWGLKKFIDPIAASSIVEYIAISALLFGTSYYLFYWLMRLRNFGLAMAVAAFAAVAIRWALLV